MSPAGNQNDTRKTTTTGIEPSSPEPEVFPVGLHNAFWFSGFNALSYQIVLSSPMVLYAKTLGASATILGLIAGMMPLLVIFQIPAANYVPRLGFKRFVYAGWGTRVAFIFIIAAVPLASHFLDAVNRLGLLLILLFCFNLSRGISSCAWLPWITVLVPESLRGKYLSLDAAVQSACSFVTFLIAAACLSGQPGQWQFAGLFAFSAVAGFISLSFLKKIPDAEMPEETGSSRGRVPWLAMIRHAPFKKLLMTVAGWSIAYGGMTAFTVAFMKTEAHMTEGRILLVTSVAFLGGLSSLWLLGPALDRLGSKPVLMFCFCVCLLVLGGWVLLAGGRAPIRIWILAGLQFGMGLLAAIVQMANTRLAMAIIPVMGRNHFFAIYSVVANVILGLAPVLWGLMIDVVGNRSARWAGLEWNRYTIFFASVALVYGFTVLLARRLDEPKAASMDQMLREILVQTPLRFWLRFWPRG